MKATVFVSAGLALALLLGIVVAPAGNAAPDEVALIRKQCSAFVTAFNSHDAKGMAAIYAADADMIEPDGAVAKGRAGIEKAWAKAHGEDGGMANATLRVIEEPVRLVTDGVAVSDATARISGIARDDGSGTMVATVHVTNVWRKAAGGWELFACRAFVRAMESESDDMDDEEDDDDDDDDDGE